ncbi:MAG: response regulator [Alphaproteobacteria bacterium]|nr:response regulator [Alphaproteobacteria bacterium]
MDKAIIRSLLAFLIILSFCAGILGYLLVHGNRKIETIETATAQTYQVIVKAQELASLVEGMVSSQRGYMMSGKEYFLTGYEIQKSGVSENIASLSALTSENKSQASRLDEIRNHFGELTVRLEERTKEYRPVKVSEYVIGDIEIVNGLKDDIIRTNNALLKEEKRTLNDRLEMLKTSKSQYFLMLVIGGLAGTAALVIFNGFLFYIQSKKKEIEKSLRDTEERFALAIQGTNDGIFDWNLKTGEVFYSTQFFAMLGYDRPAFIGTIENFTSLVHPDDLSRVWQYIERYMHRELSEYSNTFRMKHVEGGRWVWIHSRAKAVFNRDGEAIRIVGAQTDITFMKEYQERLKAEKQAAERENQAKSEFLAHMSHEIRTPLTAISGIAEILQKNPINLTDKQVQLIQTLNSSTSSLKDIVNDILDFSKIESGELELEEDNFSVEELLDQVKALMAVNAREKGLNFRLEYEDVKNTSFYGDRLRLRQILINLIGNAIKFTEAGDIAAIVTRESRSDGPFLKIEISDTGIGIPPEKFDVIFERFKQADSSVSRKYGGTGLGLSISKNLAQLMGGQISLQSEVGKGSTFTVLLPLKTGVSKNAKQDEKIFHKKRGLSIKASLNAESRALIVEDYEGNIVVLSFILDDIGCNYDIARTGLEALNFWKEKHYDLILMDVQMPEMDGFTATSQIRKMEVDKKLQRTPIVGMTAHALVGDKDKCIAAGMDAYLAKPIVESDLKIQILKYLNARKKAA